MTAPTSKRAMRQLSVREKIDAVQRVHEGESKASVARQIGVPESTLRGWCKNEMKLKTMDKSGGSHSSPSPSPPLEKRPRLDGGSSEGEIDDTLWFWLKNQQQQEAQRVANNNNQHQPSWFWKWYKEFGVAPEQQTLQPLPLWHDPDQPLPLVVRRNKEVKEAPLSQALPSPVLVNSNKETEAKENNNQSSLSEDEDDPPATAEEALKHGLRFLRWLECCSTPSVTTVQLLQFRYLLNSVKSSAEDRAVNKTRSTRSRRK